ncbi:MAG: PKD domain-containing protein [Chitinophagales bacterium]
MSFLLANTVFLNAQPGFEKVYGGALPDWFRAVISTSDGGIIAGGATRSFGFGDSTNSDGYVVKMNGNGDTAWTRHFGEYPYNDVVNSVVENDQGYLAAGFNVTDTPSISTEYYAIQYDVNGTQVWESFYGTPGYLYCTDALTDNHQRNILAGAAYSTYTSYDFYLVKTNSSGIKISEAILANTGYDWANAIIQTADGGYALAGYTNGGTPGYDIYVVKTDSNFLLQWSHNYGSSLDDYGYDLTEDSNGNLWILGSLGAADSAHLVLIKTDASGENAQLKFPRTSTGDFGYKIQSLKNSGFLIAGITATLQKGSEMLLEKLDASGDTIWTRHFGGSQNESGLAVAVDAEDNILLAGETEGFGIDEFDAYLVKLDSNGNIPCPPQVSFISSSDSLCEDENVFFTNTSLSSQQFSWSENGSEFSDGVDAAFYFAAGGNFEIRLSACSVADSQSIVVKPKPATDFTYTNSGLGVSFTLAAGISVQSISWNFGDGSPLDTTGVNPFHSYSYPGMYWVLVSVTSTEGCDSTYIEQISLLTGIKEIVNTELSLFPNPAHQSVTLKGAFAEYPVSATLLTAAGKTMSQFSVKAGEQFSLENFPAGFYILKLQEPQGEAVILKLEIY